MKRLTRILVAVFLILSVSSSSLTFDKISIENYSKSESLAFNTTQKSTTRNIKNIAVFIEFSDSDTNVVNHLDDEHSVNNANLIYNSDTLFEMDSVKGIISVPSFKKYFERESYGKMSITTEIFPKVNGKVVSYQDTHPIGYYLKQNEENPIGYKDKNEGANREKELINNAVRYIKNQVAASGITASDLDTDGDNKIDAISFIIEGQKKLPSSIAWGDILWSHESSNTGITEQILGKDVNAYTLLRADDYTEVASLFSLNHGGYGTIIHEFGHVLGFRDLYRYGNSNSKPVGFYDIMGNAIGSNPQSFLTYFTSEFSSAIRWHNPIPVINKSTENITLFKPNFIDANEKRAIKIQIPGITNEYFIVEYHEKLNTYESYSADSNGIIIYRVNEQNKYNGNGDGSNNGKNDHIYVFRPGETGLGQGLGNLSAATLNMQRKTFGKDIDLNNSAFDNQTIFFTDGTNSGISINVISETSNSVTFNVKFTEFDGNGTKESPYLIKDANTFLYLMSIDTENKYYKLATDIDFNNISNYPSLNFEGNLDGNNKTLANIRSNGTGVFNNIGAFNSHTKIENLFIENIIVTGNRKDYLGGFANVAENITLTNVRLKNGSVTNEVEGQYSLSSTGGFIGNVNDTTIIDNCSTALNVSSTNNAGGFIGINQNATIKNSFANGTIKGQKNVGGFIGIQAINSTYKTPINVYFNNNDNNLPGAGGYVEGFHDLSFLNNSSLSMGIISITNSKNINMDNNAKVRPEIFSNPNTNLNYLLEASNSNIAISDNQIVGVKPGSSVVYIDILIGTGKMRLEANVTIKNVEVVISEDEVLKKLGLKKNNGYVTGFKLGTNVKTIKSLIANNNIVLKSFKNSSNIEINDGLIATGMKFTLFFNNTEYNYTVVIKGDVNGDGEIYATDYVKVKNHIMGKSSLAGAYLLAADINNDGNIYATDYVQIKNHIMGKTTISQK